MRLSKVRHHRRRPPFQRRSPWLLYLSVSRATSPATPDVFYVGMGRDPTTQPLNSNKNIYAEVDLRRIDVSTPSATGRIIFSSDGPLTAGGQRHSSGMT